MMSLVSKARKMMRIKKDKKPRSLSYVLKTSDLESLLKDAGIEIEVYLNYSLGRRILGDILEVSYWPPRGAFSYPRLHIYARVVPNSERKAAREALLNEVLLSFRKWLIRIVTEPENSSILLNVHDELHFQAQFVDGQVNIINKLAQDKGVI